MKTYTILYAEDVPHYAIGDIKARGLKDAIAKARTVDTDHLTALDPDWSNPVCRRIVHITDEKSGEVVAEDVRLDNYTLEQATDQEITIRKYARELLEALERAHLLLDRISDTLHYEDGLPVTALEARDIEIIYGDAVTELAPIETLIRKARGQQ
jgi:hypothetical protein